MELTIEQTLTERDDLFAGHGTSSQSAPALAAPNVFAFSRMRRITIGLFRRRPARAAGDQIGGEVRLPVRQEGAVSVERLRLREDGLASLAAAQARPEGVRQDACARAACSARCARNSASRALRSACSARCRSKLEPCPALAAPSRSSWIGTLYPSAIFCNISKRVEPLSVERRAQHADDLFQPAAISDRERRAATYPQANGISDRRGCRTSAAAAQPEPFRAPSSPSRSCRLRLLLGRRRTAEVVGVRLRLIGRGVVVEIVAGVRERRSARRSCPAQRQRPPSASPALR